MFRTGALALPWCQVAATGEKAGGAGVLAARGRRGECGVVKAVQARALRGLMISIVRTIIGSANLTANEEHHPRRGTRAPAARPQAGSASAQTTSPARPRTAVPQENQGMITVV